MKDGLKLRDEIEHFKSKMNRVETLITEINKENRELRACFNNLIKIVNHELVASLDSSTEILKTFKRRN